MLNRYNARGTRGLEKILAVAGRRPSKVYYVSVNFRWGELRVKLEGSKFGDCMYTYSDITDRNRAFPDIETIEVVLVVHPPKVFFFFPNGTPVL